MKIAFSSSKNNFSTLFYKILINQDILILIKQAILKKLLLHKVGWKCGKNTIFLESYISCSVLLLKIDLFFFELQNFTPIFLKSRPFF